MPSAANTANQELLELDLRLVRGDFQLHVEQTLAIDGVTAIFGRSGSGKTTLLRCIAGFEHAAGRISFCGDDWLNDAKKRVVPAHKRGVGYMFQQPGLFRHLNVAQNLEFARSRATKALKQRDAKADLDYNHVLEVFALGSLMNRATNDLSGGEAQRVALARTLLSQPDFLLLDEPLAGLDDASKRELLPFLETLTKEFDLPTLYVSHDIDEVARLAARLLVLDEGTVSAYGPTQALFQDLEDSDFSDRYEAGVLLDARVIEQDEEFQITRLQVAGQTLSVPIRSILRPGDDARLRVNARDVAIAREKPVGISIRNVFAGCVASLSAEPGQPFAEVVIRLDAADEAEASPIVLRSRVTRAAAAELELAVDQPVYALVKTVLLDNF